MTDDLGDVRAIGSHSIGATNVLRTGNKKIAALTLLLDCLKGTAAVLLAFLVAAKLGAGRGPASQDLLIMLLVPWMAGPKTRVTMVRWKTSSRPENTP